MTTTSDVPTEPSVGRMRRWFRVWSGVLVAGLVFVVAFVAVLSVWTVQRTFLDDSFYNSAFAETETYDRVYTELFADPEVDDTVGTLLADLPVDSSIQVAALRLVLPPDLLQEAVEAMTAELVAYVKGDIDELAGAVDITEVIESIEAQATSFVAEEVAALPQATADTAEELAADVEAFADSLARGEIPDTLPVVGELDIDPALITVMIVSLLDTQDEELVELISAHVAAGDVVGAVTVAATEYVAPYLGLQRDELLADLDGDTSVSLADLLADATGTTEDEILNEFEPVRGVAGALSPVTGILAILTMAVALTGALLLAHRKGRSLWPVTSWIFLAAGLTGAALMGAVVLLADGPLDDAVRAGADGWGLPGSLRSMLEDVRFALGDQVGDAGRRAVTVMIAVGLLAGIVGFLRAGTFGDIASRDRKAAPVAVAGLVGLVVIAGSFFSLEVTVGGGEPRRCNGHEELCDRAYDDVVFAASHNSMSDADRAFIWPEHDLGIPDQLDYGIRVLLIDTHYWETAEETADYLGSLPDDLRGGVDAFLDDRAQEGAFLCHNLCGLGAIPVEEALADVATFLDDNPNEVVTLFIQDDITNADTEAAFEAAGLLDDVYVHDADVGWPTLGEMIDNDERLVVLAEESGQPPEWYHQGFELVQDTPFTFETVDDFSCELNRGPENASVLLMNHWLDATAASRADTALANDHDVIVERARACEEERGTAVNFVAVNFYSIGDVLEAVDTLNGVETGYETS